MSIVRPNPIAGIVEEQINTPGTSSNSEIFLDTTQGILLGTSQDDDKQESGGLIQGEPHSSKQKTKEKGLVQKLKTITLSKRQNYLTILGKE